jgi:hypothetical protein
LNQDIGAIHHTRHFVRRGEIFHTSRRSLDQTFDSGAFGTVSDDQEANSWYGLQGLIHHLNEQGDIFHGYQTPHPAYDEFMALERRWGKFFKGFKRQGHWRNANMWRLGDGRFCPRPASEELRESLSAPPGKNTAITRENCTTKPARQSGFGPIGGTNVGLMIAH